MIWEIVGGLLFLAVVLFLLFYRPRRQEDSIRALILLYRTPTKVQAEPFNAAAQRVGEEVAAVAVGSDVHILVGRLPLMVMQAPVPYGHPDIKPEEIAENFLEARLKEAVLEHQSFASFYSTQPVEDAIWDQTLIALGRVLAEYADDEALMLWRADNNQCIRFSPEMREELKQGRILDLFNEGNGDEVMLVDSDDERMAVAVAEARRRWPEFVAAFRQGDDPDSCIAKGPFGDGHNVEYMWISVTEITADTIQGKLLSSPFKVRGIKEGQLVMLPVEDLNDWAFISESGPVGMFTERIIRGG